MLKSATLIKIFLVSTIFRCVFTDHDVSEQVGSNTATRPNADTLSSISLIPNDLTVFTDTGTVVSFTYYTDTAGVQLKFQIWRKQSGTTFTLMHQTGTVTSSGIGSETYRCSASEVFTVTADDTIGVSISGTNPIPYSTVGCTDLVPLPLTASSSVSEGSSVGFSRSGSDCKEYSYLANVIYDSAAIVSLECPSLYAGVGFKQLTSTGYDGSTLYSTDINECWQISLDTNYTSGSKETFAIEVQMLALDFEDGGISGDCNGDSLAINDGGTVFATLLHEMCGSTYTEYMTGSQSQMYIRMYTDSNDQTVGTGFSLQYRLYQTSQPGGIPNWALAVGIVGLLIIVVPVVVVAVLWFKLRRHRKYMEDKEKLKDGEENAGFMDDSYDNERRNRSRVRSAGNKIDPQMMIREKSLYGDPKGPAIRVDAHKDASLKGHIPEDRVPQASDYKSPRNNNKKMRHWSKMGSELN